MIRPLTLILVVTLLVIRVAAPMVGPAAAQGCGGAISAADICPVPGLPAPPRADTGGGCHACVLPSPGILLPVPSAASALDPFLADIRPEGRVPLPDRRPPRA